MGRLSEIRLNPGTGRFHDFLALSIDPLPGSAGAAVVGSGGEVVGMVSALRAGAGLLAVPATTLTRVGGELNLYGQVRRGWMGLNVVSTLGETSTSPGVPVSGVVPGSPSEAAGILPGDVILRYNDKEVASSTELPVQVAKAAPGSRVNLEVLRNGQTKRLDVTLGEVKDTQVAAAAPSNESHGRLGLAARSLTPEERKQIGATSGGVVVEQASGPAAEAGIQPGDVILSINGTPVKSAEELRNMVAKAGKHVALLVQRDEAKIFVPVDLG